MSIEELSYVLFGEDKPLFVNDNYDVSIHTDQVLKTVFDDIHSSKILKIDDLIEVDDYDSKLLSIDPSCYKNYLKFILPELVDEFIFLNEEAIKEYEKLKQLNNSESDYDENIEKLIWNEYSNLNNKIISLFYTSLKQKNTDSTVFFNLEYGNDGPPINYIIERTNIFKKVLIIYNNNH
jgi:hypothetical protein